MYWELSQSIVGTPINQPVQRNEGAFQTVFGHSFRFGTVCDLRFLFCAGGNCDVFQIVNGL